MSATIHRLPTKPNLRVAAQQALPLVTITHFDRELRQIALRLHEATGHFGMLASEAVTDTAMFDGSEALEAALFHALTLKGCRNEDRSLRELLSQRLAQRQEACRD